MEFKNIQAFNPATCISAKVMKLDRLTANIFRKHLSPFNITDSQLCILFVFSKIGGITQKQLSEITFLKKSSLNRNLKRLFERGFLTREDFPAIKITLEGKMFVENIIPEWERAMSEIRYLLGEDGVEAITKVLSKLKTHP